VLAAKRVVEMVAGVIFERIANRILPNGPVTLKFASVHDLRRSFDSRWSRKVTPAVLKRLMRHADIETTMRYYVDLDADDIAAELWQSYDSSVGVGTRPNQAEPDTHRLPQT